MISIDETVEWQPGEWRLMARGASERIAWVLRTEEYATPERRAKLCMYAFAKEVAS